MTENPNIFYNTLKKEIIDCPICQSNHFTVLYNNDRYKMGVQTVICNQCSLIYINPRPIEEEMAEFYKNSYRKFYESIEVPTEEYINNGPFIPRAKFVLNVLKPYLSEANCFMDIGCAEGTLLNLIEEEYPKIKTYGIEPSTRFGEYANQKIKGKIFVNNYQKFIKQNPNQKFDILAITHVLEHILNPITFLENIKLMMRTDSILYIEVPNIMDNRVAGIGAIHIGHVLSFDPLTLKILLETCGFEIVEFFTKGLPAKTPAMSVICKLNINIEVTSFPGENAIRKKADWFIKRILGNQSKKMNNKKSSSIFQKIIKKIFM